MNENTKQVSFDLLTDWMEQLLPSAVAAGHAILEVRARGFDVFTKADTSPVTAADHAAEAVVLATLEQLSPIFPIVAEERAAAGILPACGDGFWLVDALDGTKEFVKGGTDFTVNIGFICDGLPVLGIVHAPAREETFVGVTDPHRPRRRAEVLRHGSRTAITVRPRPARVVITGSKSHEMPELMTPFLANYDVAEKIVVGSSLKFCLVAEGKADIYPRFGPTSEWDTAAGHAVLRAAGGSVHDFNGREMDYRKANFLNGAFLAEGRAETPSAKEPCP